MNSMDVLAPNHMGSTLENHGLHRLVANRGLGVTQLQEKINPQKENALKDKMRNAYARQYGKTKEQVNF